MNLIFRINIVKCVTRYLILSVSETPLQAEIKASNERIKQMDPLQRKLKTKKTMITKNLKKSQNSDSCLPDGRI